MAKPVMLITGSSKGLGAYISKHFARDYSIISHGRTVGDITGDMNDPEIQQQIVDTNPFVFINNACDYRGDVGAICTSCGTAAINILMKMYTTMDRGYIINISSDIIHNPNGVQYSFWNEQERIAYAASKYSLKYASNALSHSRRKHVCVTSLELGWMEPTPQQHEDTESLTYAQVADVIRFIINQPLNVNIPSIELTTL